jgi:hypothetical protein
MDDRLVALNEKYQEKTLKVKKKVHKIYLKNRVQKTEKIIDP